MSDTGCFKNFFATVGCVTVLIVGAVLTWVFWPQIKGAYDSFTDRGDGVAVIGVPSAEAYRSAEEKEASIARRNGAGFVQLTPDEVASLIEHRLHQQVRDATDSIRVSLVDERIVLEGGILLEVFGADALGPLGRFLGSRQPIRMGGEVDVREPGEVAWSVDEFVIRSFPFPQSAIPLLVNRLSGDTAGAFLIPVPESVAEVHVESKGVTLYRQVN